MTVKRTLKLAKKTKQKRESALDTYFHRTTSKYAQKALEKPQSRWQQCRQPAWCYAR